MKYTVDKNSTVPAYLQLYEQIKRDMESGSIAEDERLPSKRQLAEEAGVSVITAEHVYELLEQEGYIYSRQRSGYFAGANLKPGKQVSAAGFKPVKLQGEVDADFPFSVYARIMRRTISDYDRKILAQSPGSGCEELRQAIAGYFMRSRRIQIKAEQVVIGSGAEYLYAMVVQLLGRRKSYALEDPSYAKIRSVYEANGAKCEMLPMGEDGIISASLSASSAGVLHVTPFRSFPSGVTASAAKRQEYAAWARSGGRIIVEDDYDSEFSAPSRQISTVFSICPECVIYIGTFSGSVAKAVRTAYMILPEKLAEEYSGKLGFYSCPVPVFEQLVLAEFLNGGHMERYINRRRRKEKQVRQENG